MLASLVSIVTRDPDLNAVTGTTATRFGLYLVMEAVAVIIFVVAGVSTRGPGKRIATEAHRQERGEKSSRRHRRHGH